MSGGMRTEGGGPREIEMQNFVAPVQETENADQTVVGNLALRMTVFEDIKVPHGNESSTIMQTVRAKIESATTWFCNLSSIKSLSVVWKTSWIGMKIGKGLESVRLWFKNIFSESSKEVEMQNLAKREPSKVTTRLKDANKILETRSSELSKELPSLRHTVTTLKQKQDQGQLSPSEKANLKELKPIYDSWGKSVRFARKCDERLRDVNDLRYRSSQIDERKDPEFFSEIIKLEREISSLKDEVENDYKKDYKKLMFTIQRQVSDKNVTELDLKELNIQARQIKEKESALDQKFEKLDALILTYDRKFDKQENFRVKAEAEAPPPETINTMKPERFDRKLGNSTGRMDKEKEKTDSIKSKFQKLTGGWTNDSDPTSELNKKRREIIVLERDIFAKDAEISNTRDLAIRLKDSSSRGDISRLFGDLEKRISEHKNLNERYQDSVEEFEKLMKVPAPPADATEAPPPPAAAEVPPPAPPAPPLPEPPPTTTPAAAPAAAPEETPAAPEATRESVGMTDNELINIKREYVYDSDKLDYNTAIIDSKDLTLQKYREGLEKVKDEDGNLKAQFDHVNDLTKKNISNLKEIIARSEELGSFIDKVSKPVSEADAKKIKALTDKMDELTRKRSDLEDELLDNEVKLVNEFEKKGLSILL